jgi:hypothetical protein
LGFERSEIHETGDILYSSQASPKLMPPRQRGETRREAVGERRRYLAKGDLAGSAMGRAMLIDILDEVVVGVGVVCGDVWCRMNWLDLSVCWTDC